MDVPWLTTEQMVEVDRAMIEDYRIPAYQLVTVHRIGIPVGSARDLPRERAPDLTVDGSTRP